MPFLNGVTGICVGPSNATAAGAACASAISPDACALHAQQGCFWELLKDVTFTQKLLQDTVHTTAGLLCAPPRGNTSCLVETVDAFGTHCPHNTSSTAPADGQRQRAFRLLRHRGSVPAPFRDDFGPSHPGLVNKSTCRCINSHLMETGCTEQVFAAFQDSVWDLPPVSKRMLKERDALHNLNTELSEVQAQCTDVGVPLGGGGFPTLTPDAAPTPPPPPGPKTTPSPPHHRQHAKVDITVWLAVIAGVGLLTGAVVAGMLPYLIPAIPVFSCSKHHVDCMHKVRLDLINIYGCGCRAAVCWQPQQSVDKTRWLGDYRVAWQC